MDSLLNPVNFSLPGVNLEVTEGNNSGMNSIPESTSDLKPYTIPPAIWILVCIVIGYIGIRFMMED